jgi:hypothetical protein
MNSLIFVVVQAAILKLPSDYLYENKGTFLSHSFLFRRSYTPSYISPCHFKFLTMFLEYNQSYFPFFNSSPFCVTSSLCCVSPDRHRVFSRVFWQSMSPVLAISCFLSQQHNSCSLLHGHYLWLMVSCQYMISSKPRWHTGIFYTRYCTLCIMVCFVILGNM